MTQFTWQFYKFKFTYLTIMKLITIKSEFHLQHIQVSSYQTISAGTVYKTL